MHNLSRIEECYQRFIQQTAHLLPDGTIEINLKLLRDMDLLNFQDQESEDDRLTRYFHVVETKEKITLINEEFIVWIVPNQNENAQATNILISLNKEPLPVLEVAYFASGVYNTSNLVLKVLENLLNEIHENELVIKSYQEAI
ncbi:MAG: hypothetical protein K940chlam3_01513 [Chlamydiae bacterium]|nr:hypothetical protein [Chlamydiota bacterium]